MHEIYENPLCKRYASREMQEIFSDDRKFSTWRKLWIALAESEKELGLDITDEQIAEMKAHIYDIDYEAAAAREKEVRHDVMAHIYAYGLVCPTAKPIIHLGATSCYVGDNTDIILQRDALLRIRRLLLGAISALCDFAEKYADLDTLAYTHFQAAQPTTVGKRATLWMQDLMMDLSHLDFVLANLKLLGCRGTTGTGASFLELFGGDHEKVKALEKKIAEKMGFDAVYAVSGQTYTRKVDFYVLSVLSGIAQSAYKMAGDIRLLANLKEIEEPFEKSQVGSSAMAYKRNPMRSERVCSLSRYLMSLPVNAAMTHSTQWFERTLDDSANRRIVLGEAFLTADVILSLAANICNGIQVWPKVIHSHIMAELPFMATENILMEAVRAGGDRQDLHEAIRSHSMEAGKVVKAEGKPNDLIERLANDPLFAKVAPMFKDILDPKLFIGRAPQQVEDYLAGTVRPLIASLSKEVKETGTEEIKV